VVKAARLCRLEQLAFLAVCYDWGVQYTLQQLRDQLEVLIARSKAGEEIVITCEGKVEVRLVPSGMASSESGQRPPPGLMKSKTKYIAPDFDAPIDDFKEYLE